MKTTATTAVLMLFTFFLFAGTKMMRNGNPQTQLQEQVLQYPENVRAIIDNKCLGCHSDQGKTQDAMDALMWDDLPRLSKVRQVATLDAIIEVLDEGIMPPQRMVEMNPDAALSEEELKVLRNWAETTADQLLD